MQDTFVTAQLVTLGITIAVGFLMGICYDLLGVLRYFVHVSRPLQFVLDICFWLCMTAFVLAVLFLNNWLEVRAYVFFGLGAGGLLYVLILRRFWRRVVILTVAKMLAVGRRLIQPFISLAAGLKAVFQFCRVRGSRVKRQMAKIKQKLWRQKKE